MTEANYLNLNGHLLKVFLAIYDTNSVSKAAEKFDLNQSTISYSLEKLRDCLGDPLFVKVGRGIAPTDRAIMLVPHIRVQLAGLEGLVSNPKFQPNRDDTRITIASNVTEVLPQFDRLYRSIRENAPNMPVRFLDMGPRQNVGNLLDSGTADLVVTVRMQEYPVVLCAHTLFSEEMLCYYDSSVRGPITSANEYYEANHAALDFGGKSASAVDQILGDQSPQRNILLQAPNVHVLARLVGGTDLVVTMHAGFRDNEFAHLSHCKPPIIMHDIAFDMVWHRRANHSNRSIWLRNMTMKQLSTGFDH